MPFSRSFRDRRQDTAVEVAWQLGHRNSVVTRTVYIQEIKSAERRARLEARYCGLQAGEGPDLTTISPEGP